MEPQPTTQTETGRSSSPRQVLAGPPTARRQPAGLTVGSVWSEDLASAGAPRVLVNRSHFAPGSRTCWHSHPAGQTLVVESGLALVQEAGGPVVALAAGSSVVCPPGVSHWHGAAPDHVMTQLAVTGSEDGSDYADWGPPVTDAEYDAWDGTVTTP